MPEVCSNLVSSLRDVKTFDAPLIVLVKRVYLVRGLIPAKDEISTVHLRGKYNYRK